METSENLPETSSNTWTSFVADSHVKTSAKPENVPESRELARGFGLSSPALLGWLDLDTCVLKTYQVCLFQEQCEEWSETWPDAGMWELTSVYELRTSELRISESESSSWPTATVDDAKSSGSRAYSTESGRHPGTTLTDAIRMWPTARAEDSESCGNHPDAMDSLTGATRNWATPNAHDGRRSGSDAASTQGANLKRDAENWATPQAHDNHGGKSSEQIEAMRLKNGSGVRNLNEDVQIWQTPGTDSFRTRRGERKDEIGLDQQARFFHDLLPAPMIPDGPLSSKPDRTSRRRLNPRFVEWLMGFPIGWTEP